MPGTFRLLVAVAIFSSASSFSAFAVTSSNAASGGDAIYQQWRANTSEPVCQTILKKQLLKQQVIFSDSHNAARERRFAEESIDLARTTFAKNGSFCEASFVLQEFVSKREIVERRIPKTGQIQSFRNADQDP